MRKTEALKENILNINPEIRLVLLPVRLTSENIPGIFSACDVIVEAFDRAKMKEMLIETVQEKMPQVPLVVGSGMAGLGNTDSLKCRKIDDFLYVCGDESTEASKENPPIATRVGIVSHMQANIVIEILMKKNKPFTE
jgi:sulfur carrier protein ThiS adenylyltransferase